MKLRCTSTQAQTLLADSVDISIVPIAANDKDNEIQLQQQSSNNKRAEQQQQQQQTSNDQVTHQSRAGVWRLQSKSSSLSSSQLHRQNLRPKAINPMPQTRRTTTSQQQQQMHATSSAGSSSRMEFGTGALISKQMLELIRLLSAAMDLPSDSICGFVIVSVVLVLVSALALIGSDAIIDFMDLNRSAPVRRCDRASAHSRHR